MSANGIISGGESANDGVQPGLFSSVKDSVMEKVSSLSTGISSLGATIKNTVIPPSHQKNNEEIARTNTILDDFRRTVKQTYNTDSKLAEADFRRLVLPTDFSFDGLPGHLIDPIRKSVQQLPETKRTFEELENILLQNKTEEKSVFSNYGTQLMQLVVDYATTDFTTTPNELTAKNKTHTIAEIKETFSKNSPVMGALLATGKLL
ncbi:hypothetical protein EB008_03450, partial [bacterium]|nr:hypothetical protein [bacterium]